MTDTTHHPAPSRDDIVDRLVSVGAPPDHAAEDADQFLAAATELAGPHQPGYLARMVAGEELRWAVAAAGHPVTAATAGPDTAVLAPTGPGRWHGPECGYDTIGWVRAAAVTSPHDETAVGGLLGELVALLNATDDPVITHRWTFTLDGRPLTPERLADPVVRAAVRTAVTTLLGAPDPLDVRLDGIALDPDGGRLG